MSSEQGATLRSGRIIENSVEANPSTPSVMAEVNHTDSDSVDNSDISSQLCEMKLNYERKIVELKSEFSQLKDLMMTVIKKSNDDNPSSSSQGLSKRAATFTGST